MLKKNEYWFSLLIGAITFFILFTAMYFYVTSTQEIPKPMVTLPASQYEKSVDVLGESNVGEISILPTTKIFLTVIDDQDKMIDQIQIDSMSLLGLTEEEIKIRFEGYEVQSFSDKQVMLIQKVESIPVSQNYVLGVSGESVCIIGEEDAGDIIKLPLSVMDFSSATYSMLLKKQIHITASQKEALLKDTNEIQKILQAYARE